MRAFKFIADDMVIAGLFSDDKSRACLVNRFIWYGDSFLLLSTIFDFKANKHIQWQNLIGREDSEVENDIK